MLMKSIFIVSKMYNRASCGRLVVYLEPQHMQGRPQQSIHSSSFVEDQLHILYINYRVKLTTENKCEPSI